MKTITVVIDMNNVAARNYSMLSYVNKEATPPTGDDLFASVNGTVSRLIRVPVAAGSPFYAPNQIAEVRWIGVWDGVSREEANSFRHREFSGYKAGRKPYPDGYTDALERVRSLFRATTAPQVRVLGWEADDVIATVVGLILRADPEHLIVVGSSDRDLLALCDDARVAVYAAMAERKDRVGVVVSNWWTDARILRELGFGADLLTSYKALVGDKSDAVPGTSGFGDKSAKYLLSTFGALETAWQLGGRRTTDREERRVAKLLTPENLVEALKWREFIRLRGDVPGLDGIAWHRGLSRSEAAV